MRRTCVTLITVLVTISPASADIYKCEQPNRNVVLRNYACDANEKPLSINGVPIRELEKQERERRQAEAAKREASEREASKAIAVPMDQHKTTSAVSGDTRGLVMSCVEARAFLTTVASIKNQGYPLSKALSLVASNQDFSSTEKGELRQIISGIYQHDLSPQEALMAATLACK